MLITEDVQRDSRLLHDFYAERGHSAVFPCPVQYGESFIKFCAGDYAHCTNAQQLVQYLEYADFMGCATIAQKLAREILHRILELNCALIADHLVWGYLQKFLFVPYIEYLIEQQGYQPNWRELSYNPSITLEFVERHVEEAWYWG